MPEGHTIHRLEQDLARDFGGVVVTCSSPQGRFPDAATISGEVFHGADAIGKHLFLRIGEGRVHIHLGLFGRFRARKKWEDPRPTIRLRIEVPETAEHPGGINIFGRGFGNYDQDIVLRLKT